MKKLMILMAALSIFLFTGTQVFASESGAVTQEPETLLLQGGKELAQASSFKLDVVYGYDFYAAYDGEIDQLSDDFALTLYYNQGDFYFSVPIYPGITLEVVYRENGFYGRVEAFETAWVYLPPAYVAEMVTDIAYSYGMLDEALDDIVMSQGLQGLLPAYSDMISQLGDAIDREGFPVPITQIVAREDQYYHKVLYRFGGDNHQTIAQSLFNLISPGYEDLMEEGEIGITYACYVNALTGYLETMVFDMELHINGYEDVWFGIIDEVSMGYKGTITFSEINEDIIIPEPEVVWTIDW